MESLWLELGQCGPFQLCHVTLVQLCRLVTTWAQSVMIFGLYNPGWRCIQRNATTTAAIAASTTPSTSHVAITPFAPGEFSNSNNSVNDNAHSLFDYQLGTNISHFDVGKTYVNGSTLGSCRDVSHCDHIEYLEASSSTIVTEFGLICDRIWIAFLIVSLRSGGMFLGAFFWGQIGERYGRKIGLYGSTLCMGVSCGLGVFSTSWELYAVFTFLTNFGAGAVVGAGSVLCMEFLNSKWRARVSSIPVWNIGMVSFALMTYILRDWRHIHIASAVVSIIPCLGYFWTPESLRWLVMHGRTTEAENVINKIAKLNKRSLSEEAMKELIRTNSDTKETVGKHCTYIDLFKTKDIALLTLKLGLIWGISMFVCDVIGFGIQSLPGNFYTNIIIASVSECPGPVFMMFLASRIGRRWTGVCLAGVGIVCCSGIVVALLQMEESGSRDVLITSLTFITKTSAFSTLALMMYYTAELMPTSVRSLAFGYCALSMRLAGMVGPFLLPRDIPSMIACFAVLMTLQLVECGIFLTFAETRNKALQDVSLIRHGSGTES